MFNAVKELDELDSASAGIVNRLEIMDVKRYFVREPRRTPTERRTPIPAKIVFAEGNA